MIFFLKKPPLKPPFSLDSPRIKERSDSCNFYEVYMKLPPNLAPPSGVVSASADVKFSCGNRLRFFIAKKDEKYICISYYFIMSTIGRNFISLFSCVFFLKEMTCPARTWPSVRNTIFGHGLYISVYKYGRHLRDTLLFQTFITLGFVSRDTVLSLAVVDQTVYPFMPFHSGRECLDCIPSR